MSQETQKIVWRYIGDFFIILLLVIIQVSLLNTWPRPISSFNIILSFIIFVTLILSYHRGLIWALIAGYILDIYTYKTFGSMTISLFFAAAVVNVLFDHFFTNRSYYSLIVLGALGSIVFVSLFTLVDTIGFFLHASPFRIALTRDYFYDSLWVVILNVVSLVILFGAFNFLTKKAKSVFLVNE